MTGLAGAKRDETMYQSSVCNGRPLHGVQRVGSFMNVQGRYSFLDAAHNVGIGVSLNFLRSVDCQLSSRLW